MTRWQTLTRIILPNSFRRALPAYSNEVIFMLQGSAVAGIITIVDLTGAARIINSRYYSPFEAFLTAGLLYMLLTFVIVWLFKKWEARWHATCAPHRVNAIKSPQLRAFCGCVLLSGPGIPGRRRC